MIDPAEYRKERQDAAKKLRDEVPRSSHGEWKQPADRPDPVDLITEQNTDRVQFLVPIRHQRMLESPFAFYRGSARIMATDLAHTPVTGFTAQICGDAHLANFGTYASPERSLVFDINDFDETLRGPWEWDVKRLAASFVIAARHNGLKRKDARDAAAAAVAAYRTAIQEFSEMPALQVWYSQLTIDDLRDALADTATKKDKKLAQKAISKARGRTSAKELQKLTVANDGEARIKEQAPLLIPLRDLQWANRPDKLEEAANESFARYTESVNERMKVLLGRYELIDYALKVVGVGSVGTRCLIGLLIERSSGDPLFLQIKEATRSVLEEHLPLTPYDSPAERVVHGQRIMQSSSDTFLGWTTSIVGRSFYWRQLKDWKGSANTDEYGKRRLRRYAGLCGWTLARSHARSGDPVSTAAYLGDSDAFDEAMADFAEAYADQNEADYAAFKAAADSGKIPVSAEES